MKILTEIVQKLNEVEELMDGLNTEIKTLLSRKGQANIKQAIEVARKGIRYIQIESSREVHNFNSEDRVEYFSDIRASRIATYNHKSVDGTYEVGSIDEHELWLTVDGRWVETRRSGHESFIQNEWWGWARSYPVEVEDPAAAGWDMENILFGIAAKMKKNLKELTSKVKSQTERLERLESIKREAE
jgi:hypothetical protein